MRTISAQSSGWIISSGASPDHSAIAVSTKPGQIAIARTPSPSSSAFWERVSAITAAFVAPYTVRPGVGVVPAIDARLTIQPFVCLSSGIASRLTSSRPRRLMFSCRSMCFVCSDSTVPPIPIPAELTQHVQAAEAVAVLCDDADAVFFLAHVGGHGVRAELGGGRFDLRGGPGRERQLEALVAQHPRDREADARRAAGDECARHRPTLKDTGRRRESERQHHVPLP